MSITMTVYTLDDINSKEKALNLLKKLKEYNMLPEKIGSYEPLKEQYTHERFIELWTEESEGCYEDGIGMTGKAGGIICKSQNPRYFFIMNWWSCPNRVTVNYIDFSFTIKTFRNYRNEIVSLFKEVISLFNGIYGYITHEIPEKRQHVTGNIETRMPGIFWCNYFGKKYVDFFGEEKISSFPWYQIQGFKDGLLTFLTENVDKELIKSNELEKKAKIHLGEDSFGDVERQEQFPEDIQVRNVPRLY